MDTDKIKRLLEAYFDATADSAQEAELKQLLAVVDSDSLPEDMAADVRLARTLLNMPITDMEMPADFAASLCSQVECLERRRMNKHRFGRWLVAGLTVAASLLVLIPTGSVQRTIVPASQTSVMVDSKAEPKKVQTQGRASATISSRSEKHLAQAASVGNVKSMDTTPGNDAAAEADIAYRRTVEYVDSFVLVTEYYDPAETARLQAQAQASIPVDAPIYVSFDGMGQTYESIEESPEVITMIEEVFGLIADTRHEMTGSLNESKKIVAKSINEINDNH